MRSHSAALKIGTDRDRVKQDSEVVVWWGKGEAVFLSATQRAGVERIPGVIESIYMDDLHITCEGAIMLAGETDSPIRDVSIRDSSFTWKRQGSLPPDCLDEQPSKRGVYPYAVPTVYIRCGERISVRDKVRYEIDDSMKEFIRHTLVFE